MVPAAERRSATGFGTDWNRSWYEGQKPAASRRSGGRRVSSFL